MTYTCPQCSLKYEVSAPGRYSCRDCGPTTILVAALAKPAAPPVVAKAPPPTPHSLPAAAQPAAAAAPPPVVAELPAVAEQRASDLRAAIMADPNARASYLQLAQIYADHGQGKRGAEVLKLYLAIDPDNSFVKSRAKALEARAVAQAPLTAAKATNAPASKRPRPRVVRKADRRLQLGIAAGALLVIALASRPFLFPSARPLVVEPWSALSPQWSPSGDRVAFIAQRANGDRLCVVDVGSGTVRELASPNSFDGMTWAPNGQQLAFVASTEDDWRSAVFVVGASGSPAKRIAYGTSPSWSGDSTRLALVCPSDEPRSGDDEDHGESTAICVADVAAATVRNLVSQRGENPAFSPREDRVVFVVREEPDWDARQASQESAPRPQFDDDHDPASFAENALAGGASNLMEADRGIQREAEARDARDRARPAGTDGPRAKTFLWEVNSTSGSTKQLTFDGNADSPRWTRGGERLLYLMNGAAGPELWWMSRDGTDQEPLGSGVEVLNPELAAVTGDLRHLVVRGTVTANEGVAMLMAGAVPADLYDLDLRANRARRLENKHGFKQDFTLSPDGKRIAYEYTNPKTSTRELWLMKR